MNELEQLKERIASLEARQSGNFLDGSPLFRPTIVAPMIKVYESGDPLYQWMDQQALPVIPLSYGRLYKVIDDLGPVYTDDEATGAIGPDPNPALNQCAERIDINVCDRDFRTFRVAVEACLEATDVDVPFVSGRDAIPEDAGVSTLGDYRDVRLGEAMRQAKDFLLNQGLGNTNNEPESLETLINQNTTPNIVDNAGMSAFEFSMIALLAKIGLTTLAHSFIRNAGDMVWYTHPLVEMTMSRRAALPGLQDLYTFDATSGVVRFQGIPVFADRNVFVDPEDLTTSIFLLRTGHLGVIEHYDVDQEYTVSEATEPGSVCDDDCKRLVNYMTGLSRGVAKLGRVINVKPMLVNTIVSGLSAQLNNASAGTTLGGTPVSSS